MTPTLSVMMPNYNHAQFIPEALEAILAQSCRPLEVVILDDGSTDDSLAIVERYREREPSLIRLVRNPKNTGLMANINRLLEMARGDFVYFAAMDDRVLPGFFEGQLRLLSLHPSAGLCSTLSRIIDATGKPQGLVRIPIVASSAEYIPPKTAMNLLMQRGSWFLGNTTIFNTLALREAGGFRNELGPYCDGFASLVLAAQHGACFVPEPLAEWRRMETTYSRTAYQDIERSISILDTAEALMRSEFAELLSPAQVHEWRRDMVYRIASSSAGQPGTGWESMRRLVPPTALIDRLFYQMCWRSGHLGRALAKPYLFVRLRRSLWQLILRRLIHLRFSLSSDRPKGQGAR